MAPIARQIPNDLRAAMAAAQRRDVAGMTKAAQQAAGRGTQIGTAIRGFQPEPSPDPRLRDLISLAIFGQQGGFFFTGGGDIPNTDIPDVSRPT
jgi:hypothetical protein